MSKIIPNDKVDKSIKDTLDELEKTNLNFKVVGSLLSKPYLKEHVRFTKDIDIIFNDDFNVIEAQLRHIYQNVDFFYEEANKSFYEPSFTCLIRNKGVVTQLEGKRIGFYNEVNTDSYIYEGIEFKGANIEYVIAEKVVSLLNELDRPYKHLVDIYSFSLIDQSLIDKKEINRYIHLINEQENIYRKKIGLEEYKLPNQIPKNKEFTGSIILTTLQAKHNIDKKSMLKEVNKWLKQIIML